MMFKPDPKKQVVLKFAELFGREAKPLVTGYRKADGSYLTEVTVDDVIVATASHRDWRKAYALLKVEVENLFIEGTSLI